MIVTMREEEVGRVTRVRGLERRRKDGGGRGWVHLADQSRQRRKMHRQMCRKTDGETIRRINGRKDEPTQPDTLTQAWTELDRKGSDHVHKSAHVEARKCACSRTG